MVNFFCRQERTFGLGNFINCTPTLKALSDYYKKPIPVLFESIGDGFLNCPFITHIHQPQGRELFGSYTINSSIPDWQFIFNKVQIDLGIKLGEIPGAYIDRPKIRVKNDQIVILRGCFSNIPHKVLAKDPGDVIYMSIIQNLLQRGEKVVFVGTKDDKERAKNVFDYFGKTLIWNQTSLREAIAFVNSAKLVIGNDTGLMHAAAALGKKCFCMWERTNFEKNRTRGNITYSRNFHDGNFQKWINKEYVGLLD